MACRVLDVRTAASTVWAFNTGGSLRFIGNSGELPAGLKRLWKTLRCAGQRIDEPPVDLGKATQEMLRNLLLDVMSGHGLTKEDCCFFWSSFRKSFLGAEPTKCQLVAQFSAWALGICVLLLQLSTYIPLWQSSKNFYHFQ